MLPARAPLDERSRPPAVARALGFVRDPASDRFEEVALAVFAHQFSRIAPYRRLCERSGAAPDTVTRWEDIPPVPAAGFREAVLAAAPPRHVFETSGTSGGPGRRGRHHLPELALYEAAWPEPFRRHLLPDRPSMPILSLVPPRAAFPRSSLAFMVSGILERFGEPGSRGFLDADGFDAAGWTAGLEQAERGGRPVLVIGTALGLVEAFERVDRRFRLPPGSRVMDTGGMKGRRREVAREALLAAYAERLGVPPSHAIAEYGMTELSSQFYETVLAEGGSGLPAAARRFQGPPWTRTRALDPGTLRILEDGRPGLLAHWDLANAWTAAAVLTEDLGLVEGDRFALLGRAAGGEVRGCSLATEEILHGE